MATRAANESLNDATPEQWDKASKASPLDTQVGGKHYTDMKIQPIEYSMANDLDACQHTIIKYVSRFRNKGGVEDLRKARQTLDLLIHFETNNTYGETHAQPK